ncbi:hypothetical protein [Nonlabens marinus]|uniref:hypothetical protein n=1 Tax=Nonlabens marinus TaxID=930802 RepID=UPI0005A29776|nr:hypothetical protein [Nonlabens marinus]
MKHYKIKDEYLVLTDSSSSILAMPYIALSFTAVSLILTIISNRDQESDAFTVLTCALLILCLFAIGWALIKKTYKNQFAIADIKQVRQGSVDRSLFYLVLHNGKQRNLSEVKENIRATELLMMLREINPSITANFTEKEVKTR